MIGIVTYLLPKEQELYGSRARLYTLELKRNLESMAKAVQPWRDFHFSLDLRTKPKLSDKLNLLMNNQQEFLRARSGIVIVVGAKEIEERSITVKVAAAKGHVEDESNQSTMSGSETTTN